MSKDSWFERADGTPTRIIEEIGELDLSACTWPAYEATNVGAGLRSFGTALGCGNSCGA